MKGIILAGGSGTRLYPVTRGVSKQLLPVYDKPMIYYPLSILMLSGIRDILIITTPNDKAAFQSVLGDGASLGISLSYKVQEEPRGLPEAFILGKEFINNEPVMLILGDNIFYGDQFVSKHIQPHLSEGRPTIFAYMVNDPERYGVVEFDSNQKIVSIEEKPKQAKSSYAVTGLYIFDGRVSEISESLTPSARGELEIVDIMKYYLAEESLNLNLLGRGTAWLDTGTHDSLLQASTFIEVIEKRQGVKIACLEEVAFNMNYIDRSQLEKLAKGYGKSTYADYIYNKILGLNL